jgi:ABC-type transporter Mla subunit MlaD
MSDAAAATTVAVAATVVDPMMVVLILGGLIIASFVVLALIQIGSSTSSLDTATQSLEDAITTTTNSFQQFAGTILSALSRFTSDLRDVFTSLLDNLTSFVAQSLTFLTNAFTRIFKQVEHLALKLSQLYTELYYKISQVVESLLGQLYAKMITIPTQIGSSSVFRFCSRNDDHVKT